MVETKKLVEGSWVTVALVKESPTKKAVILTEGEESPGLDGNPRLVLAVEIDATHKKYSPNKTSMIAFGKSWGSDSAAWVGKAVTFVITMVNGRESIIGSPLPDPTPAAQPAQ